MPHRAHHLIIAVTGLVIVAILFLIRADLKRHAKKGNGLKQKLVAAGLSLLAALGFTSAASTSGCTKDDPAKRQTTSTPGSGKSQAKEGSRPGDGDGDADRDGDEDDATGEARWGDGQTKPDTKAEGLWRQYRTVKAEAKEIASGKKGRYPFDRAGKKRILRRIEQAKTQLQALVKLGRLNQAEAGLLQIELAELGKKVAGYRPTEMRMASCYEPMRIPTAAEKSLSRLEKRLPLLNELARSKTLHPKVVEKILSRVQADLATLTTPDGGVKISAGKAHEAKQTVDKVKKLIKKIKVTLSSLPSVAGPIGSSPAWRRIEKAWKGVTRIASLGGESTTAQRKEASEEAAKARKAIEALEASGRLTKSEAAILTQELDRHKKTMYRHPPKDTKVMCYDMAAVVPARMSLKRITKRLPLLEKMAKSGRVRPSVLKKTLPAIKRDIARLSTPKELATLSPAEKIKAQALAAKGKKLVAKLEKMAKAR